MSPHRVNSSIRAVLLVSSIAILACPLGAQEVGSITGRVASTEGQPISGATVRVAQSTRTTTTGENGRFRIEGVSAGPHRIDITAIGFTAAMRRVTVRAGSVSEIDVVMPARVVALEQYTVQGQAPGSVRPAEDVLGTLLAVGVKSEVVEVSQMNANVAEKTPRQVFARVPGIFVYDMDGSGNQVNISTRGLDAHRSWEMNVRQDGVLLNSDIYGYPASHYSPPMEAIQRVELIRGTAALQYGSQFGGLLNYVTAEPKADEPLHFESKSSAGAFGLLSSYAGFGGGAGSFTYQAYAQARRSDGFRRNGKSDAQGQYLAIAWRATPSLTLRAQAGRSMYVHQIPGPLNDSMFYADAQTSTRSRNYFNPDIIIPAVIATWQPSERTRVSAQVSGVFGERASVQFIGFANQPDTVLTATGQLATRQVDIDRFNSVTTEVRATRQYSFGARTAVLATGLIYSNNDLHRRQQGTGTTGSGPDFTLSTGDFRRNIHYRTKNLAWYAENDVRVTSAWSVIPGARIERGRTHMTGTLAYYDPATTPTTVNHRFPLFGVRSTYRWATGGETYGGWSQAFRPMILQDVLPANALERTDPNLKDARGWTLELGQRGLAFGSVSYDVTGFVMRYNDKFGVQSLTDANGPYQFKTNVGSTENRGLELSVDAPVISTDRFVVRASTATSYFDATYREGTFASGGQNFSVKGNRVEAVPHWITRNGLHLTAGRTSTSVLVSHITDSFADALNTRAPTATGSIGLVPSYTIVDVNGSLGLGNRVRLKAGVNNVFDARYFTKRPTFYPGPGIWPSDGRGLQLSLNFDAPLVR